MRADYEKAKLGFGNTLLIVILSGILIVSLFLFVMMFIEPADYPERVHDFSTVEEVKSIKSYTYVKDAVKYLATRANISEIDSISYVFRESLTSYQNKHNKWVKSPATYVDVCVEYTASDGKHISYLSVDKYTNSEYSFALGRQEKNHYDVGFSTEDDYNYAKRFWLGADSKDVAYERVEREFNEFSINTIWQDVKMSMKGEN